MYYFFPPFLIMHLMCSRNFTETSQWYDGAHALLVVAMF